MNSILFINKMQQFGYHTISYYYCKYLKDYFRVNYICFDIGLKRMELENINIYYLKYRKSKLLNHLLFIRDVFHLVKTIQFSNIIIVQYDFAFLLKLILFNQNFIYDIRTGAIDNSKVSRALKNMSIYFNSLFFDKVSIISKSLGNKLHIPYHKITELPLGAEIISDNCKDFNFEFNFLYVGKLQLRKIDITIKGIKLIIDQLSQIKFHYYIIADGNNLELQKLNQTIVDCDLKHYVTVSSYIPHNKLKNYFDKCNIGISFIPITSYYNFQPPTKTFEYLLSGMACIATKTYENEKIVNQNNGVVCYDTPESFAEAILYILKNSSNYDSKIIRKSVINFQYDKIVRNIFLPLLGGVD